MLTEALTLMKAAYLNTHVLKQANTANTGSISLGSGDHNFANDVMGPHH